MIRNESLKKQNYYYQETKNLFDQERAQAKKHLIYAQLRLKFLDWLERGYMDELIFKMETEKVNLNNLEESQAWQEAVIMFAEELKEDDFYVDIVGGTENYSITWSYGKPQTPEEKAEVRKIIKESMDERKNGLPYKEKKKLDNLFHSLMNMKTKEKVIFHNRYQEFQDMIKNHYRKGDDYQSVLTKLSKASKRLKGKSALETFLTKK
jgi:hypothetical protein